MENKNVPLNTVAYYLDEYVEKRLSNRPTVSIFEIELVLGLQWALKRKNWGWHEDKPKGMARHSEAYHGKTLFKINPFDTIFFVFPAFFVLSH